MPFLALTSTYLNCSQAKKFSGNIFIFNILIIPVDQTSDSIMALT